jgi:hypothetical protein
MNKPSILIGGAALVTGVALALLLPRSKSAQAPQAQPHAQQATGQHEPSAQARAGGRPGASAPNFLSAGSPPGSVVIDPTAPDYDPVRAIKALSGNRDLHALEPRDPAWADPVEKALTPLMSGDLRRAIPQVSDVKVSCKTTTCLISWEAPREHENMVRRIVKTFYSGAVISFPRPGHIQAVYAGGPFFAAVKGRPTALIAQMQASRDRAMTSLREGRAPQHIYASLPETLWK